MTKPLKPVVIRSGGLGDFLLTLPLLRAVLEGAPAGTLITRRIYYELVRDDIPLPGFCDIDGPDLASLFETPTPALRALLADATVYSFLPDHDGEMRRTGAACGVQAWHVLPSRPRAAPHVAAQMFAVAGLPVPADLLTRSWLSAGPAGRGEGLWVHPGSGSPAKNAPLWFLAAWAERWLSKHGGRLTVSFGEADQALRGPTQREFARLRPEYVIAPPLGELRRRLAAAAAFLGNDSGPGHLAAALGLPTTVIFQTTDPALWQPLGREVEVLRLV